MRYLSWHSISFISPCSIDIYEKKLLLHTKYFHDELENILKNFESFLKKVHQLLFISSLCHAGYFLINVRWASHFERFHESKLDQMDLDSNRPYYGALEN